MTTILTVNPGSTTTMVALFENGEERLFEELHHPKSDLSDFPTVADQLDYRFQAILDVLHHDAVERWDAVAGRGGLLHPMEGGVYAISDAMLDDMQASRYGEHPCNLGAPLARMLARLCGNDIPAVIVDPVVTDEMDGRARFTGLPGIERRSVFHALNQKGAVRKTAKLLGITPESGNFLVMHIGGGISVGAHRKGRVADVINALDGEGPFSPERTGSLPNIPVLSCIQSGTDIETMKRKILREGGLYAHLGTNDLREVEKRIREGDRKAEEVFEAFAYTMSKYLLFMLPALAPSLPDAIILTGGASRSRMLVAAVRQLVEQVAPVHVVPGSVEMEALALATQEALPERRFKEYSFQE